MKPEFEAWSRQYKGYLRSIAGKIDGEFAFIGGTALSLVYLQHRRSEDLDFIYLNRDSDPEFIVENIANSVDGDYELETNLKDNMGKQLGQRWYLLDGAAKIKIDVIENRLIAEKNLEVGYYEEIPVLSLANLYESKIKLLASQSGGDEFGFHSSREQNVRDWLDVYELSQSVERLSSFLLNSIDTSESLILNIEEALSQINGDRLRQEARYLCYEREFTKTEFIQHFEECLDTWYGFQFENFP